MAKKGGRLQIPSSQRQNGLTFFGGLNFRTCKFYWKSSEKGNSISFISFLTQLRQQVRGKHLVIILDNSSIHKSKKVKSYLQRHQKVYLFSLPTYSPEYNPFERFWNWQKPKIYGFTTIGGKGELISRFRKYIWHYNEGRIVKPIKFSPKTYNNLL